MTETVSDALAERDNEAARFDEDNSSGVLALREDQSWWSRKQVAALRSLGIKNATQEDLLVFFHYCQKTGLDPFSKEIYLLERRNWNKAAKAWEYTQTIQVGIDGYRSKAQTAATRHGVEIDYEPTIWYDADEKPHDVWISAEPPAAALVTVVKVMPNGGRLRYPGFCRFDSYAAYGRADDSGNRKLMSQWGVMPEHMIEKCAEAFGLRRAFPRDLGGMFIEEELMNQQQVSDEAPPKLKARRRAVQPEDDTVIPGAVTDGAESNGEAPDAEDDASAGEPAGGAETTSAGPAEGNQGDPSAQAAAARIAAVFREYGLGGREAAKTRRAVVTGLLSAQNRTEISGYVDPNKLTPAALGLAADAVAAYCDLLTGTKGEKTAAIIKFADGVSAAVEHAKGDAAS